MIDALLAEAEKEEPGAAAEPAEADEEPAPEEGPETVEIPHRR